MQGILVQPLAQEDPTCQGATDSVGHSCLAYMHPIASAPQQEKPLQWEAYALQLNSSPRSLQVEKALIQQQRPGMANK